MKNRSTIKIASELSDLEAMRVNDILRSLDSGDGLCFDFTNLEFSTPYGMLFLAQSIREFRRKHHSTKKDFEVIENNPTRYEPCRYMKHVGFFRDAGFNFGKEAGEARRSTTYIPITEITFQKFYESYEDPHELLEQEAEKLATLLVPDEQATEYRKVLQYVIFEALRNAMEHSDADCVRICGQRWDGSSAEIAILDAGIGVLESLNRNTLYSALNSERDALRKAVEEGVSRSLISKKNNKTAWDNSGYGLYMLKKICEKSGSLLLVSNGATLTISEGEDDIEGYSEITGTSLKIAINLNELLKLGSLHENLKRYREESKSPVKPSASSMASYIK